MKLRTFLFVVVLCLITSLNPVVAQCISTYPAALDGAAMLITNPNDPNQIAVGATWTSGDAVPHLGNCDCNCQEYYFFDDVVTDTCGQISNNSKCKKRLVLFLPSACNDYGQWTGTLLWNQFEPYQIYLDGINLNQSAFLAPMPNGLDSFWVSGITIATNSQLIVVDTSLNDTCAYGLHNDLVNGGFAMNNSFTCTNSASLTVFPTQPTFVASSYLWNTGDTTQTITGLSTGNYSCVVIDTAGNIHNVSGQVSSVVINPIVDYDQCQGGQMILNSGWQLTGYALITGGMSYNWINNTTGISGSTNTSVGVINNPQPGNYSIYFKANYGACIDTMNYIVHQKLIGLTKTFTPIKCFGDSSSVLLVPNGGTPSYVYNLISNNGSYTGNNNSGLFTVSSGTYKGYVIDSLGCTTQTNWFAIVQPSTLLTVNAQQTLPAYCGNNNGGASVAVTGGGLPYNYSWTSGSGMNIAGALHSGIHIVTINDNYGCIRRDTIVIDSLSQTLNLQTSKTDVSCFGGSNGSVVTSISGGTYPYTYAWNTGLITQNISGLSAGTYSITVTSSKGCSISDTLSITSPSQLQISASSTNAACSGGTGTLSSSATGGTFPYTYAWTGSNYYYSQNVLVASLGSYYLNVTDANGCGNSLGSVSITSPQPLVNTASITNDDCEMGTGAITLNVTGGTTPYTYSWNNGAMTQNISGLSTGNYSVIVTDANGCMKGQGAAYYVSTTPAVSTALAVIQPDCYGDYGVITLNVTGGTAPCTYSWNNGASTSVLNANIAGTYSAIVTDANGCTDSVDVEIVMPSQVIDTLQYLWNFITYSPWYLVNTDTLSVYDTTATSGGQWVTQSLFLVKSYMQDTFHIHQITYSVIDSCATSQIGNSWVIRDTIKTYGSYANQFYIKDSVYFVPNVVSVSHPGVISDIKIYPNPVHDILYVDGLVGLVSFEIINMLGQKVLSGELISSIDISGLSPGMYIVNLNVGGKVLPLKFIKE